MRIPVEEFNLGLFVDQINDFIRRMEPTEETYGLVYVDRFEGVPVYQLGPAPEAGTAALGVLDEMQAVFFPFGFNDGNWLTCADGISYGVWFIDDPAAKLVFSASYIGYLVRIKDGHVLINGALSRPGEKIELLLDSGFFEKPLGTYILGFKYQKEIPTDKCDICGCAEGDLHQLGCLREWCPFCGGQLASCQCYDELFPATPEDAFEFTEDDERWVQALEDKGRRPNIWWPNICIKCGKLWPEMFHVSQEDWEKYVDPRQRNEILCRDCFLEIKRRIDCAEELWGYHDY
jgi:hypothetical protein